MTYALFNDSACAIFTHAREIHLTRSHKSFDEQIAQITRRQDQLDAQRVALLAMKKAADRKLDARRKIIVGAAVLAHAELHPAFADALRAVLDLAITRPVDRDAIPDLLPTPERAANAA